MVFRRVINTRIIALADDMMKNFNAVPACIEDPLTASFLAGTTYTALSENVFSPDLNEKLIGGKYLISAAVFIWIGFWMLLLT